MPKKGYDVVLLDLSPKCLQIAFGEMKKAEVMDKVKRVVEGSVTDLSGFSEESFARASTVPQT